MWENSIQYKLRISPFAFHERDEVRHVMQIMTKLWLNNSFKVNLLWPIAIFSGLDKMSLTVIQTAKCIVAPRIFKDHWKLASMMFLRTSLFRNMTATKHSEKNKHLFLEVYLNPRNSEHTGWLYNSCCLNGQQSC